MRLDETVPRLVHEQMPVPLALFRFPSSCLGCLLSCDTPLLSNAGSIADALLDLAEQMR